MEDLPQYVKSFITSSNPTMNEIEFRFTERGQKFSISSESFTRVLESSKKSTLWNNNETLSDSVIIAKPIEKQKSDIRLIKTKIGKKYELKKRIRVNDHRNFNIRASEAFEDSLSMSDEEWDSQYIPTLQRDRTRTSFYESSKTWRLDLTTVTTYSEKTETSFEIELEYISKSKLIGIEKIKPFFNEILSFIQNSSTIISNYFGKQLISDYCSLLGINPRYPKFVGPLPFTLKKDNFTDGKLSCGYSVTEKADGDRKLFFIGKNGISLLISRPKEKDIIYQNVGFIPELSNSIFDGEYVDGSLYIFDTLVFKGKDVRDAPLDHRLKCFSKFPKELTNNSIKIHFKTFYFAQEGNIIKIENGVKNGIIENSNVYKISETIWKNKATFPYALDGLIFTPINAKYYNTNIFKWKESNTIDFYVSQLSETVWQLYIAGLSDNNEYIHIPFEGINKDGLFKLRKGQTFETIKNEIWFSDSELKTGVINISKATSKKFKNNSVVEFKYYGGKFIPIRSRSDKSFANNIRAINDAWDSITSSLTISVIKNGVYKSCIRQYHNSIKKYIITKFSSEKNVLDIGSGAGGDIMKYINSKTKKLVGIDIVDVEYSHPNFMHFYKVETELYNIKNTIKDLKINSFDTINCHFALHYFFKSNATLSNFIKNINENIKSGGIFIATCMDGRKINALLNNNSIVKGKTLNAKYNENTIFKIKKNYKDVSNIDTLDIVNQKIEVKLAGTKYFKQVSSIEYLVNIEKFVHIMKENKLKHIQTTSFSELCKKFPYECQSMNPIEKQFSFLNSYMVFIKE